MGPADRCERFWLLEPFYQSLHVSGASRAERSAGACSTPGRAPKACARAQTLAADGGPVDGGFQRRTSRVTPTSHIDGRVGAIINRITTDSTWKMAWALACRDQLLRARQVTLQLPRDRLTTSNPPIRAGAQGAGSRQVCPSEGSLGLQKLRARELSSRDIM